MIYLFNMYIYLFISSYLFTLKMLSALSSQDQWDHLPQRVAGRASRSLRHGAMRHGTAAAEAGPHRVGQWHEHRGTAGVIAGVVGGWWLLVAGGAPGSWWWMLGIYGSGNPLVSACECKDYTVSRTPFVVRAWAWNRCPKLWGVPPACPIQSALGWLRGVDDVFNNMELLDTPMEGWQYQEVITRLVGHGFTGNSKPLWGEAIWWRQFPRKQQYPTPWWSIVNSEQWFYQLNYCEILIYNPWCQYLMTKCWTHHQ